MSVESTEALERSVLESKDREQLLAIAAALGVKATSRAKKADIIAKILEQTGGPGAAEAPRPGASRRARRERQRQRPGQGARQRQRRRRSSSTAAAETVATDAAEPPAAAASAAARRDPRSAGGAPGRVGARHRRRRPRPMRRHVPGARR